MIHAAKLTRSKLGTSIIFLTVKSCFHCWQDGKSVNSSRSGPRFNIKMTSYQYRKSHCGDKTILRPSYLHNGISYTGKTTSLYWIRAQVRLYSHVVYKENSINRLKPFHHLCHWASVVWCWWRNIPVFGINTMLANALAPKVATVSAGMVLAVRDRQHV